MKLLRWTIAGASFYVIYKYSIGKKAQGEGVLVSAQTVQAEIADGKRSETTTDRPKRVRTRRPNRKD